MVSRNGIDVVLLDTEQEQLLRMTAASGVAGGMISTMKSYAKSDGPVMTVDDAIKVFAEVYEKMFGVFWAPPTK